MMNKQTPDFWDKIAGKWQQLRGEVRKQWGKITDDDWDESQGQHAIFLGKLRERYGLTEAEAHEQIEMWARGVATRDKPLE